MCILIGLSFKSKLCTFIVFTFVFDFAMVPLIVLIFLNSRGQGIFGHLVKSEINIDAFRVRCSVCSFRLQNSSRWTMIWSCLVQILFSDLKEGIGDSLSGPIS